MTSNDDEVSTLIEEKQFDRAVAVSETLYKKTKDSLYLNQQVDALMHLEEYDKAIKSCLRIIRIEKREKQTSDQPFIIMGIPFWLKEHFGQAIEVWKEGSDAVYTDEAGGVGIHLLLLLGARHLSDSVLEKQSLRILRKLGKGDRGASFSGALALFAVGDITKEMLLERVSAVPIMRERHLCRCYYWVALSDRKINFELYSDYIRCACSGIISSLEFEYFLSRHLSKNLTLERNSTL